VRIAPILVAPFLAACAVRRAEPGSGSGVCAFSRSATIAERVSVDTVLLPPHTSLRVDRMPRLSYPDNLRIDNVEGRVRATFVLDTAGLVMSGTAVITEASAREFEESVCRFLRNVRYQPVLVAGRPRRARVVDMEFNFTLH
jgi:TonB family protein